MAEKMENLIGIVNCSEWQTSEQLIQDIIGQETPCELSSLGEKCFPWKIENKYYTTNVKFVVSEKSECDKNDDIDGRKFSAVVVMFDSTEKSFKAVNNWLTFIKSHEASVLLLVGSKSGGSEENKESEEKKDNLPRRQVLQWCIQHAFEYVDLNEQVDPEDEFPDTVGVERVIQALQTTEWPQLGMKDNDIKKSSLAASNARAATQADNAHSDRSVTEENTTSNSNPFLGEANSLSNMQNCLNDSDMSELSFEDMFSQMHALKEKASALPEAERKAYAEKVALAFWHAIGGDEEEIADLDETS